MDIIEPTQHIDDYPDKQFTDEGAREKAERLNCDIEYANPSTLQLDLDSDAAYETFKQQMVLLQDIGILPYGTSFEERPSRSGNRHITIDLMPEWYDIESRLLLQALLGSDLQREALAYAGRLKGQVQPILLFRPRSPDCFPNNDYPF